MPPRLALPPLRRVYIAQFKESIKCLASGVDVFIPDLVHRYSLKDFFSFEEAMDLRIERHQ